MNEAVITGKQIVGNFIEFTCTCAEVAQHAVPGQFVMVSVSPTLDPFLNRPLGILWAKDDSFALLFEVVGRGTSLLACLEKGDTLPVLGPLGNGYSLDASSALLLAGGRGVVTLHFLARRFKELGIPVSMLCGVRDSSEIMLERYIIECESGLRLFCCEEGVRGLFQGTVVDALEEYAALHPLVPETVIYTCGPEEMLRALAMHPLLEKRRVEVSLEALMGCGFGVCMSCARKSTEGYMHICSEGPVCALSEVTW